MDILFMGTAEYAVPVLQAVHASRHTVKAVITNPDRPSGRGRKMTAPPVKNEAFRMGIPLYQPDKLDPEFLEVFKDIGADIGLVAAYGKLIKKEYLDTPEKGIINVHPSLLPKYRGPSPIQQPILNGDPTTGVSIIQLTEEMDAGPVILVEEVNIGKTENAGQLHDRLADMGGRLAVQALDLIEKGKAEFSEQDESQATFCKKIEKKDACIRWEAPVEDIVRLVRAMTPFPGAYTYVERTKKRLKISEVKAGSEKRGNNLPGTVINACDKKGVIISAGDGTVSILHLAPEGSRRMSSQEFVRGAPIETGDRLILSPDAAQG
jgi:methionyl-tRNA formyltransferase